MADGKDCICGAYGECECACAADWTPQELIDARAEIARLRGDAEVARLRLEAAQAEPCPYVTGKATRCCTLTPFTITDAEREAVDLAIDLLNGVEDVSAGASSRADAAAQILRSLLNRLGKAES